MRIIRIRAISRAFQTRLVFMYMHCVLLDAAYVWLYRVENTIFVEMDF